ncbi:MAG: ankyrin repeat domain-containing protein [Gammaproteobacteria bacterium]|jgi:tetratricopeptide (TPR) repeat protein
MPSTHGKKLTILVSVLFGLCVAFFAQYEPFIDFVGGMLPGSPTVSVLPGENEVLSVKTKKVTPNVAQLEVEYFYNGRLTSPDWAGLIGYVHLNKDDAHHQFGNAKLQKIEKGKGTVLIEVSRKEKIKSRHVTTKLGVIMRGISGWQLAKKEIDYDIEWPVLERVTSLDKHELERNLKFAVQANDNGNYKNIREAKVRMEQSIMLHPEFLPAYHELARSHMKLDWKDIGRSKAENVLKRALELDDNYADAHVLIGYVYAHTGRFKQALSSFERAQTLGSENLWLYANWGELYLLQDNSEKALDYYQKVIGYPRRLDRNDRPMHRSYLKIIEILSSRKDWDGVDKTYRALLDNFQDSICATYDYAEFLLFRRNQYDAAMQLVKGLLSQKCYIKGSFKNLVAAIYLAQWADQANKSSKEAIELMRKAKTLQNDIIVMLSYLSRSQNSKNIIAQLENFGISINDRNLKSMTALGYAVTNDDLKACENLIRMGADVNLPTNADGWSPLMIAVASQNPQVVKLLLDAGADKSHQANSGLTVYDLAERLGNSKIIAMLKSTET